MMTPDKTELDRECNLASQQDQEVDEQELDTVTGGIIVVGGSQFSPSRPGTLQSLNPQPLPPRWSWNSFFSW